MHADAEATVTVEVSASKYRSLSEVERSHVQEKGQADAEVLWLRATLAKGNSSGHGLYCPSFPGLMSSESAAGIGVGAVDAQSASAASIAHLGLGHCLGLARRRGSKSPRGKPDA